jgi:pSer/pThr/pTyr-binding forkhead associated (FHA) protein
MSYPQADLHSPHAAHKARLLVRKPGQEIRPVDVSGRVSLGRAFDNVIFVDETCASRYHALIEGRADGFWLSDLGSINGTTVNGEAIKSERKLRNGDVISLGGATVIEFEGGQLQTGQSAAAGASAGPGAPGRPERGAASRERSSFSPAAPSLPGRPSTGLIILAIAAPVIIIGAAALVLSGAFTSSSTTYTPVHIVGVRTGDNINTPTRIRTDAGTTGDILQVIYQLDDVDLARVRVPPYETQLDPEQLAARLPGLAASNHVLSLIVEQETPT